MELQSVWDVLSNLAVSSGISVSAVFTANWIAPIKPGKDDDGKDGDLDDFQPVPTGGDGVDWEKFDRDFDAYSKKIEQEEATGVGIS
jgi:hypothetical protein